MAAQVLAKLVRSAPLALAFVCPVVLPAASCTPSPMAVAPRDDAAGSLSNAAEAPLGADASPTYDVAACSRLQHVADSYVALGGGPGAVFSHQLANGAVCSGASGVADVNARTPMRVDERLRIGSVTKTFTAALVLQLVDDKVLALDDVVSKWLPGFPRGGAATIEQLLTHTSGLVDYLYDDAVQSTQDQPHTVDDLMAVAARVQTGATPPGQWHYSNTNYLLLGRIASVASGALWSLQVRKRLLDPLGLTSTFVYGWEDVPGGIARGYERGDAGWVDKTGVTHPSVIDAAGCIVSTAPDLVRWWRAVNDARAFSPASLRAMKDHRVSNGAPGQWWGLGVAIEDAERFGTLYGHSGGFAGYTTQMQLLDGPGELLVAAVNGSVPSGNAIEPLRRALWASALGL